MKRSIDFSNHIIYLLTLICFWPPDDSRFERINARPILLASSVSDVCAPQRTNQQSALGQSLSPAHSVVPSHAPQNSAFAAFLAHL